MSPPSAVIDSPESRAQHPGDDVVTYTAVDTKGIIMVRFLEARRGLKAMASMERSVRNLGDPRRFLR